MGPLPPCRQFSPTTASHSSSTTQIKEETLLAILLLITGKPSPREELILCPSAPPWTLKLHCNHFHQWLLPFGPRPIQCCSRLSSKFPNIWFSHMDQWLYPSPLSAGGADVQAVCGRCSSSSLLSNLAGPIYSSFLAESLALVHGMELCHSHLKSCHIQ